MKEIILTISCPNEKGVLFRISEALYKLGALIIDSNHHSDKETDSFFMRLHIKFDPPISKKILVEGLKKSMLQLRLNVEVQEVGKKINTAILCSKESHCLIDLLSRVYRQSLNMKVSVIISNHETLRQVASWHNIPFIHLPITPENKREQEKKIEAILKKESIDLVVLARYMQILTPAFCEVLKGRCINIHHSFLPSFKGANPYLQAYERGVKMIGATAHFVTDDLDEGPILFQEAVSVTHKHSYPEFKEMGRDIETRVLASAVKSFVDKRIFVNARKTVIL